MIVVTVGSSPGNYSFHRLVKAMDQVLERKGWQGWMQIGSSAYRPKAPHDLFVSQQEMEEKVRNCDLVVGHCGVGTLLLAREFRKNICVLPREPQFGEILDFHQIEMAQNLAGVSWVELLQEHSLEAQIAHRLGECS